MAETWERQGRPHLLMQYGRFMDDNEETVVLQPEAFARLVEAVGINCGVDTLVLDSASYRFVAHNMAEAYEVDDETVYLMMDKAEERVLDEGVTPDGLGISFIGTEAVDALRNGATLEWARAYDTSQLA